MIKYKHNFQCACIKKNYGFKTWKINIIHDRIKIMNLNINHYFIIYYNFKILLLFAKDFALLNGRR